MTLRQLLLILLPVITAADTPRQRAQALVAKMTLEEKVRLLHGTELLSDYYVGTVEGNERLGIPRLRMNDGPQGFRAQAHPGTSTQFPSGLAIGATWNPDAAARWGAAMGDEFVTKGCNVQLGPGVCVARVPTCGRNFEYISGEDPFLGSAMVGSAIAAIQSKGVMANVKHFILNNQETNRTEVSADVDERTIMEIYAPPFWAAVDAGVLTVMCSYNRVNGVHSCQNNHTLSKILKGYMGFEGWVMSDWFATHSTIESALHGLDQEMPSALYFGEALDLEVGLGTVPRRAVDEKAVRVLTAMFAIGMFDGEKSNGTVATNATSSLHRLVARSLAEEGAVLLQNNNSVLPFDDLDTPQTTIAVIGGPADASPITGGQGSGAVVPSSVVTVLQGLTQRSKATIVYSDGSDVSKAVSLAKTAAAAVVVLATTSGEGHDRTTLAFPADQTALLDAVARVQNRTVAIMISPGAVLVPFSSTVPALLLMIMPGQEEGSAAAALLFGDVNPSGKLPVTLPNCDNEVNFTVSQYPGVNNHASYSEKLEVGYRWYNAHKVSPMFPFGHGISYASFSYSNPIVNGTRLSFVLTNKSGSRTGAEVVQLYLTFPEHSGEPPRQLKGFHKVLLRPQTHQLIEFELQTNALSIWDVVSHSWVRQTGEFLVEIGSSSQDVRLSARVVL